MSNHVSSTSFPPGAKVHLYAPGTNRPGEASDGESAKTVGKDGVVAFEHDGRLGQYAWLAADLDGDWQTVMVPVKAGKPSEAVNSAEVLANVSPPSENPDENVIHGSRDTINTRSSNREKRDPRLDGRHPSELYGSEALRVSAEGSFVTIPDGSHADPASHGPSTTLKQREARAQLEETAEKSNGTEVSEKDKAANVKAEKEKVKADEAAAAQAEKDNAKVEKAAAKEAKDRIADEDEAPDVEPEQVAPKVAPAKKAKADEALAKAEAEKSEKNAESVK